MFIFTCFFSVKKDPFVPSENKINQPFFDIIIPTLKNVLKMYSGSYNVLNVMYMPNLGLLSTGIFTNLDKSKY